MGYERLGKEWIFSTKQFLILVTSSQTVLQNTALSTASFPCSQQSFNRFLVYGAQPIRILLSMFSFSLFLAKGRGKRSKEKPLLLCTIIFLFSKSGVLSCFIPHRVLFSRKKLEKVV